MSERDNRGVNWSKNVVVALSGGVDSSVVAWRLREDGYNVKAVFMKNWEEDDREGYCASATDLADAEQVCRTLDIELTTVNLATEYWDNVFKHFLDEYKRGRTPNPDVLCNREIKFDALIEFALNSATDRLATGHYARLDTTDTAIRLLKAEDSNKDQTYFLHGLAQSQLKQVMFPLGDVTKDQVRRLASLAGLPTSKKKDSTGICFIGERPFKDFLSQYLPSNPGPILDTENKLIGEHDGLAYYTPGQRQGLGIGGCKGASGEPWYVVRKHVEANTLIAAQGRNHPGLYSESVSLADVNWVSGQQPSLPLRCTAKIRYRQNEQRCIVTKRTPDRLDVNFQVAQWAPAPGQSVVFYDEHVCLGGGVIEAVGGELPHYQTPQMAC